MRCPVCDAENQPLALECETCGRVLSTRAAVDAPVGAMPDLERTDLANADLAVDVQPLDVDRSALEGPPPGTQSFWDAAPPELEPAHAAAPPGAAPFWDPSPPDVDRGRADDGEAPARPRRPGGPAAAAKAKDPVLCPACFSRVAPGPRCVECGVPFPESLHGV